MGEKVSYQEFRKTHSGKSRKEISILWKIYKESPDNEVKRDSVEQAMLNQLNVKPVRNFSLGMQELIY
jgi:hypothetical protein